MGIITFDKDSRKKISSALSEASVSLDTFEKILFDTWREDVQSLGRFKFLDGLSIVPKVDGYSFSQATNTKI